MFLGVVGRILHDYHGVRTYFERWLWPAFERDSEHVTVADASRLADYVLRVLAEYQFPDVPLATLDFLATWPGEVELRCFLAETEPGAEREVAFHQDRILEAILTAHENSARDRIMAYGEIIDSLAVLFHLLLMSKDLGEVRVRRVHILDSASEVQEPPGQSNPGLLLAERA